MSAALISVAPKLQKLIPLLASDKDGEVLSAVAAIGRTLKQAGADYHDLAKAITSAKPLPVQGVPLRWRDIPQGERANWLVAAMHSGRISPWESSFCASLAAQVRYRPWSAITPKQTAVLDRIVLKLSEGRA
jgi:hypothetical protein